MSNKTINIEDVQRMATLARLEITDETKALFAGQFADILNYMDVLAHVDTDNIEPLYSPIVHEGILREDVAQNKAKRAEVLSNAPRDDEQYFIVPRIV